MSIHRRAAGRDSNEAEIVAALEAAGASVTRLSAEGVPDLLVGFRGASYLLEVKHLSATGRTVRRTSQGKRPDAEGRTEAQAAWWASWRGVPPVIVRTPAEALAAIGVRPEVTEPAPAPPVPAEPPPPPPPATRQRIRATTAACRERTAHAIDRTTGECACGDSIADFGAPVKLRCVGCPLEYEGKMGYADGLMAPIHWTGDEGQTKRPLCTGVGVDGVPANRDAKPANVPQSRRRGRS